MKQFKDFDKTKGYTDSETLPRGGYVCRIISAKEESGSYGSYIKVAFDIDEGDHAGFYRRKFDNNTNEDKKWPGVYLLNEPKDDGSEKDGWTKRKFKTFIDALEDSNAGYHFDWDERKFKDKKIGIIFNYREFSTTDGSVATVANAQNVTSVDKIREGKYKIPKDKLIKETATAASPVPGFQPIVDDDVPF